MNVMWSTFSAIRCLSGAAGVNSAIGAKAFGAVTVSAVVGTRLRGFTYDGELPFMGSMLHHADSCVHVLYIVYSRPVMLAVKFITSGCTSTKAQ